MASGGTAGLAKAQAARATEPNYVIGFLGNLIALLTTLVGLVSIEEEVINNERKGFIALSALIMVACSFYVANLARDLGDPVLAADMHIAFIALVCGSFVIAVTVGIGGEGVVEGLSMPLIIIVRSQKLEAWLLRLPLQRAAGRPSRSQPGDNRVLWIF